MEKTVVLIPLLFILLCFSGCVVPSGSAPIEKITTEIPATIVPIGTTTSQMMTTAPVPTTLTTVDTPIHPQNAVNLTVNSVQKQIKLDTIAPVSGFVFLVMNITIKNNLKDEYEFTEQSISLSPDTGETTDLFRTRFQRGKLDDPIFIPTTIRQNDTRTGQIVFLVPMNSEKYKMHFYDNKGVEIVSETFTV